MFYFGPSVNLAHIQEWNSVGQKMPKKGTRVISFNRNRVILAEYNEVGNWYDESHNEFFEAAVWMELPDLPGGS